jgi:hypothetical protein
LEYKNLYPNVKIKIKKYRPPLKDAKGWGDGDGGTDYSFVLTFVI